MEVTSEELQEEFDKLAGHLRSRFAGNVGFVLIGMATESTGDRAFVVRSNANRLGSAVALVAEGLVSLAESDREPVIIHPDNVRPN